MKINALRRSKRIVIILISTLVFSTFFLFLTSNQDRSITIYNHYLNWEIGLFNIILGKGPYIVMDTTISLYEMESNVSGSDFKKMNYQNSDSLFLSIKTLNPSLQLSTFNDFYNKNKSRSLHDKRKLSWMIKLRNIFQHLNQKTDIGMLHFSKVGFNEEYTQAMLYVYSESKSYQDYSIFFYKLKFGLWWKDKGVCIDSRSYSFGFDNAPTIPIDLNKTLIRNLSSKDSLKQNHKK